MTKKEISVIVGTLLGDASIQIKPRGNKNIEFEHSAKQKEYALWKCSMIDSYSYSSYERDRTSSFNDGRSKQSKVRTFRVRFQNHKDFNNIYKRVYINGRKTVTPEILDCLGELGVTIWYLDDGDYHLNRYCSNISTDSFTLEEHKLIRTYFIEEHDIYPEIIKHGKGKKKTYRIYFPREEAVKLLNIVNRNSPKNILPHKHPLGYDQVRKLDFGFHKRINNILSNEEKRSIIKDNILGFWKTNPTWNGFPWVLYQMSRGVFSFKLINTYFGSRDNALKKSGVPTNVI